MTFERQEVSDLSNSKDFISFLYCFYLPVSLPSLIMFYLYCDLQKWNMGYIPSVTNRNLTCLLSSKHGQHLSLVAFTHAISLTWNFLTLQSSPLIFLEGLSGTLLTPQKLSFIFLASCISPSSEPQSTLHWFHSFAGHSFSPLTVILHWDPSEGRDYARKQNKTPHKVKKIANTCKPFLLADSARTLFCHSNMFLLCVTLWQVVI